MQDHIAHVYHDEAQMAKVVGEWIAPALRRGSGALLACTRGHARMVRDELTALGVDVARSAAESRFVVLEAEPLMARFMTDGMPDAQRFHRVLERVLADISRATNAATVRAWGEMVDILAREGRFDAARRLESLWDEALARADVHLLCSYAATNLDPARLASVGTMHGEVFVQPRAALAR